MPEQENLLVIAQASDSAANEISIGPEALDFLTRVVPESSRETVQDDAVAILSKATPTTVTVGNQTGLIVGYVQSGKTMSFETVAALARDNRFQVVIVVAGTSTPLLDQSTSRLRRDLQLDDPSRARRWLQVVNPSNDETTAQNIRNVLDDWRDPETPAGYKKTVLITVLKHYGRLDTVSQLLARVGMQGAPTLIIDDEADQASLNTEISQGDESSTYSSLMALRDALPNHTYLQYTATPQAPLLINIIDALSPNFVRVLEPGNQYVGGREFFGGNSLARVIPARDVPTRNSPLSEPPESLLLALRIFMVGVAAGLSQNGNVGNRSMLVHPSQLTIQHQEFYSWVRDIFEEWKRVLNLDDSELDKQDLLEEFRLAYDDLRQTVDDLPEFEALRPLFRLAFRNTTLLQVNASGGRTPKVEWGHSYGWILVGGQSMDRGFTVEGLTVTYMPRGIGVGNADTIQQRARFFGYKRSYLGYCRVFLEQGTLTAFERYVAHEEDIRSQLLSFQDSGRPLDRWKRAFVLDTALRPCRQNVLDFDYMRGNFSDDWVFPSVILASEPIVQQNRGVIQGFVNSLSLVPDAGNAARTEYQKHNIATDVSLQATLEELLLSLRIPSTVDSQRFTGLMLQLSKALESNPQETCDVVDMSSGLRRERGVDENGQVTNLFQGAAPVNPPSRRGEVYPGDRNIHADGKVTIQIHHLNLMRDDGSGNKVVVMNDVPVVAIWVPARLAVGWLSA
jgi:hypothetical protein